MKDLLDLCLSEEETEMTNRAFMVFLRTNQKLIQAFLKDDTFYSHASAIIFSESPSRSAISRVATLLTNMITTFPEKSEECCGFIFKLVEFCDEPGVFDLLHQICEPNSTMYQAQAGLVEANFAGVLIQELRAEKSDAQKTVAVLHAISEACENPIMRPSVQTVEMMNVIEELMQRGDSEVRNELWGTLVAVVCKENMEVAVQFIQTAMDNVVDFYERVMRVHVFSIEFLTKMISLRSPASKTVFNPQMEQSMVRLIVQFPDCSNLMGAVFRFIKAGIRWREFTVPTLEVFVPVMTAEAGSRVRSAAAAQCMALLDELDAHRRNEKELEDALAGIEVFDEFCGQRLKSYRKVMAANYGGDVERAVGKSPSSYFPY